MTPRGYMWLGVFVIIMASAIGVLYAGDPLMVIWIAFAGGCVFGKGYGIWEERKNRRPQHSMEG
jgi:hypothetical protein